MKKSLLIFTALVFVLTSCEQSEPDQSTRMGDILQFAGRTWEIKHGPEIMGPGNNYFSDHPNDVWVDDKGYLHLSIDQREQVIEGVNQVFWHSTEVVSTDTMGYGTYVWTVEGNFNEFDINVVLGLFTWDNNTFQEQANSEVDIEFAKWGEEGQDTTLQYGVQPIAFGPYNYERVDKPRVNPDLWDGVVSTHLFTWTDSLITWESYQGEYDPNRTEPPQASWYFDDTNPPKRKYEGPNTSDPVVIPAPGNTTNARMNLWILTGTEGPARPLRHEVIIRDFHYMPL